MAEPLRFGLVGCGVIGPVHAEALASLPDARLVAVADLNAERARKLTAQYGGTTYPDLQSMLQREALDVVIVCTPSGMHGEHACQVMRAGRHVIVEKPMEIRRETLDEMLRVQQERQLVDDKAFGRLVMGNALIPWWRSQAYYDSGAWRGTWKLDGGGVLMNQSIHSIDLLQWLMGPVKSVMAYTDTLAHRMETEDVGVAALRFANGALGVIAATTAAYPGVTTRIELFGSRGSAIIENDELALLDLARDEKEAAGDYGVITK